MTLTTALTRLLGVPHPILLAPMDVVADARLTSAVSQAGGFGILGGGYGDDAWLRRELKHLESHSAPWGVGFITWSMAKQPQLLDLALQHKPRAIMLSFGNPTPFIERIKDAGALAICQVQSIAMAHEASAAGADVIVAQGTEAGGHGASRGTLTLVPEVVDALVRDVPVVAAGGIADGRGLAAALMLGAAGVLMGTRLYATEEAAGAPEAKRRICGAVGDDTARSIVFDISRRNVWPGDFTGRCLRNAHLDRWRGRELELLQRVDEESTRYADARADGDFDVAAVIAGESAGLVHEILSAREVIERTVRDAAGLLARAGSRVA